MSDLVQCWQFREKLELEGPVANHRARPVVCHAQFAELTTWPALHGVIGRAHGARVDAQWSEKSRGLLILCSVPKSIRDSYLPQD